MNTVKEGQTGVLVAGAGPTGLALAVDLARYDVPFRLVDESPEPFAGSRAKGLQPRTLEVFEDLGVLEKVLACGSDYPRFRVHVGPLSLPAGGLNKIVAPTPAVPYPNLWLLPQWRTSTLLRERLAELGGRVEHGVGLTGFAQERDGVTATLSGPASEERVRAHYLVGCDGSHSFVRRQLGVKLVGDDLEEAPIVVGDLEVDGLARDRWHCWPLAKGAIITLCPLPGTAAFQLQAPLRKGVAPPEPTERGVRAFLEKTMGSRLRVGRIHWTSLYRNAHARMVDRYRVGRVLLAGDAAHVHPPSGGQGLNTGVQDAYNLAWKLASVLAGAPEQLLDTYEAERLPIAASVLGLARKLFVSRSVWRGSETQQLGLHYRGGALADEARASPGALQAGDRAPDAPGEDSSGKPLRLFERLRGPHWTLLDFGEGSERTELLRWLRVSVTRIVTKASGDPDVFVDSKGWAHRAYGVGASALVLVRPDGYVGCFAERGSQDRLVRYLERFAVPAPASG